MCPHEKVKNVVINLSLNFPWSPSSFYYPIGPPAKPSLGLLWLLAVSMDGECEGECEDLLWPDPKEPARIKSPVTSRGGLWHLHYFWEEVVELDLRLFAAFSCPYTHTGWLTGMHVGVTRCVAVLSRQIFWRTWQCPVSFSVSLPQCSFLLLILAMIYKPNILFL